MAHRLERLKLPRGVAVVVVVLFAFSVIGSISYVVYGQVADLADKLPQYKDNIESKITAARPLRCPFLARYFRMRSLPRCSLADVITPPVFILNRERISAS